MNDTTKLVERRAITKAIMDDELKLLKEEFFNPITKKFKVPDNEITFEIEPVIFFFKAV